MLLDLDARYPGFRFRIIDEQDRVRRHILIFVGEEREERLDALFPPSAPSPSWAPSAAVDALAALGAAQGASFKAAVSSTHGFWMACFVRQSHPFMTSRTSANF